MVLGAMETPSSISPIPTKNPTTNGTISPPKNKNPQTQTQTQSLYRECLKNHAASIGGHALDGCGEFMPSPTAVPSDPTSFKCAACNCHRNFHRRHNQKTTPNSSPSLSLSPSPSPTPSPQSPPPLSHLPPNSSFFSSPPPPPPAQMLLALSTGERLRLSADSSRKRFRTKFTSEQKEKMSAFADRLGWRMQRSEEKLVEQFCDEIGVRRGVLKVWMHNNKHTLRKRSVLLPGGGAGNELGGGLSGGSTANGGEDDDEKLDEEETKSGLNFFANNGSSSTS